MPRPCLVGACDQAVSIKTTLPKSDSPLALSILQLVLEQLTVQSSADALTKHEVVTLEELALGFQELVDKYKGTRTREDGVCIGITEVTLPPDSLDREEEAWNRLEQAVQAPEVNGEVVKDEKLPSTPCESGSQLGGCLLNGTSTENFSLWQRELIDLFSQLDADGSGVLSVDELRQALLAAHIPRARLTKLLKLADADSTGDVDLTEWTRVIKECDVKEMKILCTQLKSNQELCGSIYGRTGRSPYMLEPSEKKRLAWDFMILLLCVYIALFQPFSLAWENEFDESFVKEVEILNSIIDGFFMIDILLNFRTGFYGKAQTDNTEAVLIMDWREVAKRYLTSWFFMDLFSVLPLSTLSGGELSDPAAFKVLKLGKLSKVLSVIRTISAEVLQKSDKFEEMIQKQWVRFMYRRCDLFYLMLLICHWLACGMKLVDEGFLHLDPTVSSDSDLIWNQYLTAVYWSMTTLTTVGYGDITPAANGEKAFTIVAMVIGGGFYGYVIGAVSSFVAQNNLNAAAFHQRMDLVYAWVEHHKLPKQVKLSVCRYFRHALSEKTAISEADFWQDLSPELQKEVGEYIVHADVKYNPLFDGITLSAVVRLQSILRIFTAFTGDILCRTGDAGTAMYIIVHGSVLMEVGSGRHNTEGITLEAGQSFGEETLLGLREHYEYTTTVLDQARLEMIYEEDFRQHFESMPHVENRMRHNALQMNAKWRTPA